LIALFPKLYAARTLPDAPKAKAGAMATVDDPSATQQKVLGEVEAKAKAFADSLEAFVGRELAGSSYSRQVRCELEVALSLPAHVAMLEAVEGQLQPELSFAVVFGWACSNSLGLLEGEWDLSAQIMDEYGLTRVLEDQLRTLSDLEPGSTAFASHDPSWDAALVRYFTPRQEALRPAIKSSAFTLEQDTLVTQLTNDPEAQTFLGINRYDGVTYVNKDALERVFANLPCLAMIVAGDEPDRTAIQVQAVGARYLEVVQAIAARAKRGSYKLEGLLGASVRTL
jgi:hypothetical protein